MQTTLAMARKRLHVRDAAKAWPSAARCEKTSAQISSGTSETDTLPVPEASITALVMTWARSPRKSA